jgi:UDP-2,3-diacylglucosamine pyrophosphatase LpxH
MTIFNIALLKERTAAALLLPKGELPEVGTVVALRDGTLARVCRVHMRTYSVEFASGTHDDFLRFTRYATPAEIDAFAEASALPDIVDPIVEAVRKALIVAHGDDCTTDEAQHLVAVFERQGLELCARKAVG